MRLYLYVKNAGDYTKSELTKLQEESRILVNGKKVSLTTDISDSDIVTVDGNVIENVPFVYYLYNKPVGIICTNNASIEGSIKTKLDIPERVYPIGRLDKDSSGLLILTNDSKFCHHVLNEHVEKEYIVKTKKQIISEFINSMPESVELRGKMTKECIVKQIDEYHFSIILREGKYHQIRRMVVMHGNKVDKLKRVRIGNINLGEIEEGSFIKIENLPNLI